MLPRPSFFSAALLGAAATLLFPGLPPCAQAPRGAVAPVAAPAGTGPEGLVRGMTPEQVRQALGGPPRRIGRQIFAHRYLEQWAYDQPRSLRLEFDCPRGQKPQLVNYRPLRTASP